MIKSGKMIKNSIYSISIIKSGIVYILLVFIKRGIVYILLVLLRVE